MENPYKALMFNIEQTLSPSTEISEAQKHVRQAMKTTVEIIVQSITEPLSNKQQIIDDLRGILLQIRSLQKTPQPKNILFSTKVIREMIETAITQAENEIEENKNMSMLKKQPHVFEIVLLVKNNKIPIKEIKKVVADKYKISEDEVHRNIVLLDILNIIKLSGDITDYDNTKPLLTANGEDLFKKTTYPSA